MPINFTKSDWERTKENYKKWWDGELGRPLFFTPVPCRDPGRPEPSTPNLFFQSHHDFSVKAEDIVDRLDYNLSSVEFMGDSFPFACPYFGAGVAAAFMGADVINGSGTTWFHPKEIKELADLEIRYDPDNMWYNRVKAVCTAAQNRWEGNVQLGMTDLGGNLDILSTFRPSERLLFDLYDFPEVVKQKSWELFDLWFRYYDELSKAVPSNPGYCGWESIFSEEPSYMLQSDFCYMISPEMFDEFVKPELAACCERLPNAFYHLDGPGELPHLDSLLSIEKLKGIQWMPGSGVPDFKYWPEVYRKIRDAGKHIQVYGDIETFKIVDEQLGGYDRVIYIRMDHVHQWGSSGDTELAELLAKYGM
ncbi:MAG: uroporphyrinogen decarboxylase/cobalamine-independent methonine synthase family protein [Armatimonadota bacterium]